jgi:hypothetical protein
MKQTIISSLFASVLTFTISDITCANAQQKNSATGTETPGSTASAAAPATAPGPVVARADPGMTDLMKAISESDITAMATYIAGSQLQQ